MLIASFPAGPLQANCYLVAPRSAAASAERGTSEHRARPSDSGAACVVVDPGQDSANGVAEVVEEHDLVPAAVLVTHGHFDHMWCTSEVAAAYGVPVWIHPADRHLLADPMAAISNDSARLLREQLGMTDTPEFSEPADVREAADGTAIDAAGLRFTVDHVPGHTPGTVAYRVAYDGPEDVSELMFSGDFLFAGSIGRTDLNGGDHDAMLRSLTDKVLPLADDVVVLPGHGPQTTIGRERASNPFIAEILTTQGNGQ